MDEDQDQSGWQLTESDPGVFSELLKNLHVPYIVDDLYSLDPSELSALQPIHAFIFLFKWITDPTSGPAGTPDPEFPGFFANQVVNNACATLAVLNALGNIPELPSTFQGGESPLQELISFTTGMDPADRGYAVVSVDWLREAHNSLSPPTVLSLEGLLPPGEKEEAYHFIVYLPVAGSVYELDGLQRAAIRHGACDASNWMDVARDVINARIATYPEGALEFSLLAIRDDPLPRLRAEGSVYAAEQVAHEEQKRQRWAFENSLRRHNHLGLVHALTLALAKSGGLPAAKEKAKEAMKERRERAEAEKKMQH